MNVIRNSARHTILVSISIATIALMTSCASSVPSASKQSLSPESAEEGQTLPPPPPYIPYESRPGEAENVQKVLDSIRSNRHNDAPPSSPSIAPSVYPHGIGYPASLSSPSIYPHLPGYPANLTITNSTTCQLGFYLQGPISREFGLETGKSVTMDIVAGSYQFAFNTHLCVGNVPPLFGKDVYEAGSSYTITLSQEDIQPKTGNFVVENNTDAKLTVKVNDATNVVASESFSMKLPVGSYTVEVSAKCGKGKETFDITQGSTYVGKYWCTEGEIITRPPEVGYFDVDNSTGVSLTVRVGGKTYKVRPGSTTIELPEGSYTAQISARCGSTTESLQLGGGSRHEVHYSCVVSTFQ